MSENDSFNSYMATNGQLSNFKDEVLTSSNTRIHIFRKYLAADNCSKMENCVPCPVCNKDFKKEQIEDHVNKCLFLNTQTEKCLSTKRTGSFLKNASPNEKRLKLGSSTANSKCDNNLHSQPSSSIAKTTAKTENSGKSIPLAEQMRPLSLNDIVGHKESFGVGSMLRSMLEQRKIPNMILWGPPGCGKTSMANVVANICKNQNNLRYVKLSATMAGINDVKEVVKVAKNEAQFKRQTVLFMDEIHRFNKLQQDSFLPHVENGTIILIGATTENPSFSLRNALLSRCKVIVMEKLSIDDVMLILERAVQKNKEAILIENKDNYEQLSDCDIPKWLVERASLKWLAEVCDGDARVALGALELALTAAAGQAAPALLTLDDIKNGIKRSHMLYDQRGEEHYNVISALHKAVRAGDDNAALYWATRSMLGGEDPLYLARRLVRMACEDIGLAEPGAVVQAVACLQGCQHIGAPECDVLLAQCAVALARAPKSREVYNAMTRCRRSITEAKGPLPPVPLPLRNAPTKLMKQIGYGRGYNLHHKDKSGLVYMPEGMENVDFFQDMDGSS